MPNIGITFSDHVITPFDAIYSIPSDSTAFIKVKRRKRRQLDGCIGRYEFSSKNHPILQPDLKEYPRLTVFWA